MNVTERGFPAVALRVPRTMSGQALGGVSDVYVCGQQGQPRGVIIFVMFKRWLHLSLALLQTQHRLHAYDCTPSRGRVPKWTDRYKVPNVSERSIFFIIIF